MNDFNQFKAIMKEIVTNWKKNIKPGIEEQGSYGETNTRKYLIDPILNALNWVDDGSKKIIDNEFSIKHKTGTGSADYALKVDNVPKILIEAKDAKIKDLVNGYDTFHGIKRTYPRQLTNYCHDLNHQGFQIKFAILTNGKEWILYNMQYADISSEREVVFHIDIEELDEEDNLEKLWALEYNDFVKDQFRLKELIQRLYDYRLSIDKKAVQNLLECKDLLSNSIFSDYEKDRRGIKAQIEKILKYDEKINGMPDFKDIPKEDRLTFFIKEASSSIINKILFIRILEDKNFLTPKLTKRKIEEWKDFFGYKDYSEIMNLFREACRISEKSYNGGLFRLNPYDEIDYDPNVIKQIIDILGDINFREIDSDIIGRIYEIYLGQVLKVESEIRGKKRTKYQADNKERKELGQYYTPKFVVNFIVKNTLGKMIEGKSPEEISKIRILDPACGSGSFLINAYDILSEYFEDWNNKMFKKISEEAKGKADSLANYSNKDIVPNYKNIILRENIHGVDLNDLSVQICEINLWLRALERDKKLIKLNKNILNGNSLITGVENEKEISEYRNEIEEIKNRTLEIKDYYDKNELTTEEENRLTALEKRLKVLKDKINSKINENLKDYFVDNISSINSFNWEIEFPQVMQEGGFDIVIGNPPYIDYRDIEGNKFIKSKYYSASVKEKYNILIIFIEKALRLLKDGGYLGFIISNQFLCSDFGLKIREFILNNSSIEQLIDVSKIKVFKDASTYPIIIILKKGKRAKNHEMKLSIVNDEKEFDSLRFNSIPQNAYENIDNNLFLINLNKNVIDIINKMKSKQILGNVINEFTWGSSAVGFSKKVISKEKYDILNPKEKNKYSPVINTRNIQRYLIDWSNKYIENDVYSDNKKDIFIKEKIVIGRVAKRIRAAMDKESFFVGKCSIILTDKINLNYLLALLNSKIINYYYSLLFQSTHMAGGYLRFDIPYLNNLPIHIPKSEKENKIKDIIILFVDSIILLKKNYNSLVKGFTISLSNQSISDMKLCKLGNYFDEYTSYNMERQTFNNINKINANLNSLDIKEDENILTIYISYENGNEMKNNVKAITMDIKDKDIRRFLFFSIKKYIDEKEGRGFGNGNLLELIKNIEVPVYVRNHKMNIEKIKEIMKEFNHKTENLWWKDSSKKEKFNSLTEIEEEIEKIDKEIDELVYELYGITENEKKIIEESLK